MKLSEGKAAFYEGQNLVESYDLSNQEQFLKFENRMQTMDHAMIFPNQLVEGEYSFKTNALPQLKDMHQKLITYEEVRETAFNASRLIQDSPEIETELAHDAIRFGEIDESGHQGIEYRIDESERVVFDTIAANSDGKIDSDKLRESMEEHSMDLEFDISAPSKYQPAHGSVVRSRTMSTENRDNSIEKTARSI